MANYLMKYKGVYRILPELDIDTKDIPRHYTGEIADNDIYITCQNGCKIFEYGHIDNKKPVWLTAYIPSIIRGRKIANALSEQNIEIVHYSETDEEIIFRFKARDIEPVATLMKAKTYGASISPFSTKNLPKSKVEIPTEKMALYKEITAIVPRNDLLSIHRLTSEFLDEILRKSIVKTTKNKKFDYKADMKSMSLGRQTKEYIYVKGFWEKYLDYLKNKLEEIYN
jgi:hypothetical protein